MDLPPLSAREGDLPLLVATFIDRFNREFHRQVKVAPAALNALSIYTWPGNVRELRNITQRLALFAAGEIGPGDLPPELNGRPVEALIKACTRCLVDGSMTYGDVVACLETNLLPQALVETDGNRTQAAKVLGLSLSTLRDKLKKYGPDADGPGVT